MNIWVEVQPPNKPDKAVCVGMASDALTAEAVADQIGVPEGTFLGGKIVNKRGWRIWSIVADVTIRSEPMNRCPHCGARF